MELLTLKDAAKIVGCEQSTLRHAIKRGDLIANKPGHDWLVTQRDLERWRKKHFTGSRKPRNVTGQKDGDK